MLGLSSQGMRSKDRRRFFPRRRLRQANPLPEWEPARRCRVKSRTKCQEKSRQDLDDDPPRSSLIARRHGPTPSAGEAAWFRITAASAEAGCPDSRARSAATALRYKKSRSTDQRSGVASGKLVIHHWISSVQIHLRHGDKRIAELLCACHYLYEPRDLVVVAVLQVLRRGAPRGPRLGAYTPLYKWPRCRPMGHPPHSWPA
jgi:hypothetical protein